MKTRWLEIMSFVVIFMALVNPNPTFSQDKPLDAKVIKETFHYKAENGIDASGFLTITGKNKVSVEDMSLLHIEIDKNKVPKEYRIMFFQWICVEKDKLKNDILVSPDKRTIAFNTGSENGRITFFLNVGYEVGASKKLDILSADGSQIIIPNGVALSREDVSRGVMFFKPMSYFVEVAGGVPPTPGPGPDPTPPDPTPTPPAPVFPDGKYGLAKLSYDLFLKSVKPEEKPTAVKLADSFLSISKKIDDSITKQAAGVALLPEDQQLDNKSILKAVKDSNVAVLGNNITNWGEWRKVYGDAIYDLYNKNKIVDAKDWSIVFKETSDGLREIR